jgi:hypothetical protein
MHISVPSILVVVAVVVISGDAVVFVKTGLVHSMISLSAPIQAYPVQSLALGLVHTQGPSSTHSLHSSKEFTINQDYIVYLHNSILFEI